MARLIVPGFHFPVKVATGTLSSGGVDKTEIVRQPRKDIAKVLGIGVADKLKISTEP